MPVQITQTRKDGTVVAERTYEDGYRVDCSGGFLMVVDRNGSVVGAHASTPGISARVVEHATAAAAGPQVMLGVAGGSEPLEAQVARLAEYIAGNVPGEPSRSEGAIDCAIRLLQELSTDADRYARSITTLEQQRDEARAELARRSSEWEQRSAEGREQVRRLVADNTELRLQAAGPPLQASVETIELGEVEYVDGQIGWLLTRDVLDSLHVMMGKPPEQRAPEPITAAVVADDGDGDGDRFAPELLAQLTELGGHYGPLGVALAAASLSDPFVVAHYLTHRDLTIVEDKRTPAATPSDDDDSDDVHPERSPLDGVTLTYGELRRLIALHLDTAGKTLGRVSPWEDMARAAAAMQRGETSLRLREVLGNIDHETPTRCTLRIGDPISVEDDEGKGLSGVVEAWTPQQRTKLGGVGEDVAADEVVTITMRVGS